MARLTKSRKRVRDHGEVFTPDFIVNDMLDLVKRETERIDSRFLEPACGDGNFLSEIMKRKLSIVDKKYKKSQFDFESWLKFHLPFYPLIELEYSNREYHSVEPYFHDPCDYLEQREYPQEVPATAIDIIYPPNSAQF